MSKAEEDAAEADIKRRQARLAQIEADNEHGRRLIDRYGDSGPRPRSANVKYANTKRYGRR
jgi:hypothetical protein